MKRLHLTRKARLPDEMHVRLPGSKSISNRLLVMEALSEGAVQGRRHSSADDTTLLRSALAQSNGELWLGHAGTALRFGLAFAAIAPGRRILKGSERLSERPIAPLVDALRSLGASITFVEKEGFAPLEVVGKPLEGGMLHINAGWSSQFITALMLIGPYLKKGLQLHLEGELVSRPYLEMTMTLMHKAGASVTFDGNDITVAPGAYTNCTIDVEPDWSAASYFYSIAALVPGLKIHMTGLSADSVQGDAVVSKLYESFGVGSTFTVHGVSIEANAALRKAVKKIDCLACPDLAQTLAITAAGLTLPLQLTGLQTLRMKETDRITALATELAKCGTKAATGPDSFSLQEFENGFYPISSHKSIPEIATYHDHRMAMAFAPLALKLGRMTIADPKVVSKSFPEFWAEIGALFEMRWI